MKVISFKQNRKVEKLLLLFVMMFFGGTLAFAQSEPETALPLTEMEIVRQVSFLDIEGEVHENVTISFKSKAPDGVISDRYRVRVKVVDIRGQVVYKKTFRNVYLYVFSDGQIQVGRSKFNQIIIQKHVQTGENIGMIREKEGIY